jgi:hypothetical protein
MLGGERVPCTSDVLEALQAKMTAEALLTEAMEAATREESRQLSGEELEQEEVQLSEGETRTTSVQATPEQSNPSRSRLQTPEDEEVIPDTPGASTSGRGASGGNSSVAVSKRVSQWLDQQFEEAISEYVDPLETNPRSPLSVTSNDASVSQSRMSQGAVTFQTLEPVPEEQRQDETDEQYLQRLLAAAKASRDEAYETNRKMQARIVQLREESNKAHMQLANASIADIDKLRGQMQKLKQRCAKKDRDFERLSKQVEATTNAYAAATDSDGNPIDVQKMLKDYKRVCEQLSRANIEAVTAQNELAEVSGEIDRLLEQKRQRSRETDDALLGLEEEKERSAALEDTLQRERESNI